MADPVVYLGLDVGGKRIGLARGNSLARLASPLEIIEVDGQEVERIRAVAAAEEAGGLVVGLPRGLDGQETAQTATVRRFAAGLKPLGLPVYFQDEAGTSRQAAEEAGGQSRALDDRAAAILLQDFLDNLS